jgi:phospholipase C
MVDISMANQGAAATATTHLAAYANAHRGGGPWRYTVDAGGTTSDFFNCGTGYGGGPYDLSVVGPNRFLRRFQGDATKPAKDLTVTASYAAAPDTGRQALWFAFANSGSAAVTFTVTSTNYRTDGPWTYTVQPGGDASDYFNAVADHNGWYDFTITAGTDPTRSQRFTGHLENGQASTSG